MLCCTAAILLALGHGASGQAVSGKVKATDPPPPLTYHGLIPGLSKGSEVRKVLGPPAHEASWYAWKMLYPAEGRPGFWDQVHLQGGAQGDFSCVEAASIPQGLETKDAVRARFPNPEFELVMPTFSVLDYSAQGTRFVFDKEGKTIGVAYVPHLRPRVHSGARKRVDLSRLRQGPQPRPVHVASLDGLRAGAAQVVITPRKEWIEPKQRKDFTVHDDLFARVVVFEHGEDTVAIVGADLFGMMLSEVEPIRAVLAKEGIEHLLLASSHNHAAPDTMGVYGFYPAKYIDFLQAKIAECVRQARQNLRPVQELRGASRELPMDGARVIGYFRNARNPGILDPSISVLIPMGADNKPIATIVNFACHVEGLDPGLRELSADFPGYLCAALAEQGAGQPVFLNGAVGGMVSGDTKARTHAEARVMGQGLAGIVQELSRSAQPAKSFAFKAETRRLEIPMTNLAFKALASAKGRLYRGRIKSEMSLYTIGECQMLTLPGELLPEVSFEILEKMTGFPRMLVGLANDQLGYIVPTYDFRDDYYEETMSAGPAAAPIVVDTALRLLAGER